MSDTTKPLVSFEHDEETYTIPTADEWSLSALEAFEDGKHTTLMREILGPVQWAMFKKKPRVIADVNALFSAAEEAIDSGN